MHRTTSGIARRRFSAIGWPQSSQPAVRALVQLGEGTLGALQADLQRRADPDLVEAAHGFDGPVADPLAEALRGAAFWALGECRHARPGVFAARFERFADFVEVHAP